MDAVDGLDRWPGLHRPVTPAPRLVEIKFGDIRQPQ